MEIGEVVIEIVIGRPVASFISQELAGGRWIKKTRRLRTHGKKKLGLG